MEEKHIKPFFGLILFILSILSNSFVPRGAGAARAAQRDVAVAGS